MIYLFKTHRKQISIIILILLAPLTTYSYIGPGAGLSAIGSFLALLAGIIIAILGFIWYPIKRLFTRKSNEPDQIEDDNE